MAGILARYTTRCGCATKPMSKKRIATPLMFVRTKKDKKQPKGQKQPEKPAATQELTKEQKIAKFGPNYDILPTKDPWKYRQVGEQPAGRVFDDEPQFFDFSITKEEEAEAERIEKELINNKEREESKWAKFKTYQEKEAYIASGIKVKPGKMIDAKMRERFFHEEKPLDDVVDPEREIGFRWHTGFRRSGLLTVHVPTQMASPGPPLGPLLGMHGIPTGIFVKSFNEETAKYPAGVIVTVLIMKSKDPKAKRTVKFKIMEPPTSALIKRTSRNMKISQFDIARIAAYKFPEQPLRSTYGQVRGTALSINEISLCPEYTKEDLEKQKEIDKEIEQLSREGKLNKRMLPKAAKK